MAHDPGGASGDRFFVGEDEHHQLVETTLTISNVSRDNIRLLFGMLFEDCFSDVHGIVTIRMGIQPRLNQQSAITDLDAELRERDLKRTVARMSIESVIVEALGEKGIRDMVAAFYRKVPDDDLIGPMYPESDWEGSEERLAGFLLFRFGISEEYTQKRGHPRLRMRHMPFSIGEAERDRWLKLMGEAMTEVGLEGEAHEKLTAFFAQVADFMRNRAD